MFRSSDLPGQSEKVMHLPLLLLPAPAEVTTDADAVPAAADAEAPAADAEAPVVSHGLLSQSSLSLSSKLLSGLSRL